MRDIHRRLFRILKLLLRPKILLPVLLTSALLAFAFSLGNVSHAFGYIETLSPGAGGVAFALAFAYLTLKGLVFGMLLRALGTQIEGPAVVHAYAIGEMTLPIPAGVYAQNYVLQRIHGLKFGRSSAATTVMLMLELVVIMVVLIALPIPGWYWLRPAIATMFVFVAIGAFAFVKARYLRHHAEQWLNRYTVGRGIVDLLAGMRRLLSPRIALVAFALTFAYLLLVPMALFTVAKGIGINVTLMQAVSIHFFSLGVVLLVGSFLTKLGLVEVVGLAAAQAWGYTWTQGLAMLLGFRIVWMASIWVITGFAVWYLRGQFRPQNTLPRKSNHKRARR